MSVHASADNPVIYTPQNPASTPVIQQRGAPIPGLTLAQRSDLISAAARRAREQGSDALVKLRVDLKKHIKQPLSQIPPIQ